MRRISIKSKYEFEKLDTLFEHYGSNNVSAYGWKWSMLMSRYDGLLPITIGITGHRDISPDNLAYCETELLYLFEAISKKFHNSPLHLISALAEGADRLAAHSFLNLKNKLINEGNKVAEKWQLIACLPLPVELYEKDFIETKIEFYDLLSESAKSFNIPIRENNSIESISINGLQRDLQYQDASRFVASHSDILIAVWDGIDNGLMGGTADTVKLRVSGHKFDRLQKLSLLAVESRHAVYHVPVTRISVTNGTQASFLEKISTNPSALLEKCDFLQPVDSFNCAVLEQLSDKEFSESRIHLSISFSKEKNDFLGSFPFDSIVNYFSSTNMLAIKYQKRWLNWIKSLHIVGVLTAILLPMAIENLWAPYSMIFYLVLIGIAVAIFNFLKRSRLEDKHLDYRAFAELLRIQFFLTLSSLWEKNEDSKHRTSSTQIILPTKISELLIGQHHFDLDWVSERLRNLVIISEVEMPKKGIFSDELFIEWISGQQDYCKKKHKRFEASELFFGLVSKFCLGVGLVAAMLAITSTFVHYLDEDLHHLVVVLAAAFPIISIVVESYVDKLAIGSSLKVQARMAQIFGEALRLMNVSNMPLIDKKIVVHQLANEAINECVSWLFLKKIKPIKLPT